MKIIINDKKETLFLSDALILPLCEGEVYYKDVDNALGGLIKRIVSFREFNGKQNQMSLLHTCNRLKSERVLLVGLGKRDDVTPERLRQAGGRAAAYLNERNIRKVSLPAEYITSLTQSPAAFAEGMLLSQYSFNKYKREKGGKELDQLTLLGRPEKSLKESMLWVESIASAVSFARDLINTPSNNMTPSALSAAAKAIAKGGVSAKVLDKKDAEKEGMGAYLSVAKGSGEPPRFIVLKYNGGSGRPVALIGKSITFDSGGISIKPGEGMEKMKYDMAGGAVVLAVIKHASESKLPLNLIGILPAAENLPGGSASKPGDIVSTVEGKTIEIINTDAEGRLALADAIGYAKKLRPKAIIDIATLTGACSVALGNEAIAMMGNDISLMDRMRAAGDETYERVWQMPLYEEYGEYLKSDVADIKNTGGKTGSLVTSAYFLKEFVGAIPWVHLDIASVAWADKEKPYIPKGATGAGVRLLTHFLKGIK